jgi:pimeloyl-ACP methyl ester carboxylesterase
VGTHPGMHHSDRELGIAVAEWGLVVVAAGAYMAGCIADAFDPSHSISLVLAWRTKRDTSHGPKARSPVGTQAAVAERIMQMFDFPAEFRTSEVVTNGTTIHVRSGGAGPAVILLHGYGETGDMWAPMVADLARDHTAVVPDLRGLGLSAKPRGGFDKKTQAIDVAGVLDQFQIDRADLVTHDIGNMVGFAFAALYPERVRRFVLIDAPIPGVGPWEDILKNPMLWHFRFGGPDMERLVAGRERIYLDRFWNEFSATPARFTETAREHYAQLYAMPGAMHSGFMQFAAFDQDAIDNRNLLSKGKLPMPVLAIGGEKSFGTTMADIMRHAASNVRSGVIPDSGHWVMEENPMATISMVRAFLDSKP